MARTVTLRVKASTTLDGSGNGTAEAGPAVPGEIWYPSAVAVKCSSNTNEAIAKTYVGNQVSDATFADGTTWGSTGDSTSNVTGPLYPGQQVFAVWTGGDPGATATVTITGTRSVP
jgi:hypothetical protein